MALLNITDDIIEEYDKDKFIILVLLDCSSVFDSIDFDMLLCVLMATGFDLNSI